MWSEVKLEARIFIRWMFSQVINAVFLAVWLLVQYGTAQLVNWVQPSGVDGYVIRVLQLIFAVSTVAPIGFYIYKDIRVFWIRVQRAIEQERRQES